MNNKRLCGAADLFSKLPSSLLGRHVEMFDDVQKEECIRDKSIGNFWFQNLEIFGSKIWKFSHLKTLTILFKLS